MPIEAEATDLDVQRRYWRLAALLFIGGGLGAAPSDALHQPAHEPTIYLLPLLALVSGAVCWLIAERAPLRWLHLMAVVATVEIAITVWLADDIFAIYYVFIAIYAAYVFRERRAIALHVGIASAAVLAPMLYEPETARTTLVLGFVLIPTVLITGATVAYLRERLEASERRFRELAERDPLTGVGNYRMLSERLPGELQRHGRHGGRLALIVLDLDDFKRVNDEYGHQRGDRVLQEVAGALIGTVRASDFVVRHGGDEFSIVCPETGRETVEELAGRLREGLADVRVDDRCVEASTGCAVFPDDGRTFHDLLAHADDALRGAKDGTGITRRAGPAPSETSSARG
jgi:diguanylate cyclase (GGDEF)-like protein